MTRTLRLAGLLGAAALAPLPAALAQLPLDQTPAELEGVEIVERLGETIPLDLEFTDNEGRTVRLGDLLDGEHPVILTPVFYECPMLCTLVLNGMVAGLNGLEPTAGEDFRIITFSFNPDETPPLADVKKRAYLTQYRRESAKEGWHFLVGSPENVAALTESIGFGYRRLDDGSYAHTATIVFLTPEGRIAQYMNDVRFESRDLRYALVEAAEGSIGSPLDYFALFTCFQYDPDKNSYVVAAWKVMRFAGILTMLAIVTGVGVLALTGPRRKASAAAAAPDVTAIGGLQP